METKLNLLEQDTKKLLDNINTQITTKKGKGRPKGKTTTKYNYYVEAYDIFTKEFKNIGEFFTFQDMSDILLNKYGLTYSSHILQNIYNNRTFDQYLRVYHI